MTSFPVAIAVALIYARSLSGEFLFDDHAISDMDFERWERAWRGKIYADRPARFRYALFTLNEEPRSLTHMGYCWTWRHFGFEPMAWHVVNLTLHLANVILVYLFSSVFLKPDLAAIAAGLFAVHPHQVAAVSYISGRAGLQSVFFTLAAVLITAQLNLWTLPIAALSIYLAKCSKEDAFLWYYLFGFSYVVFALCFGTI